MADRSPDTNELGSLRRIIREQDRRLEALEARADALEDLLADMAKPKKVPA